MSYGSIEAIKERCKREGIEFWKAVQMEDCSERAVRGELLEGDDTHVADHV